MNLRILFIGTLAAAALASPALYADSSSARERFNLCCTSSAYDHGVGDFDYSAFGGSEESIADVFPKSSNVGLRLKIELPDAYRLNVPTAIKLTVTYRRYAPVRMLEYNKRPDGAGKRISLDEPYSKKERRAFFQSMRSAFGNQSAKVRLSVSTGFTNGLTDRGPGDEIVGRKWFRSFRVKPGISVTKTLMVTFDQCFSWPEVHSEDRRELLLGTLMGGYDGDSPSRPSIPWPGNPCLPANLEIGAQAKVVARERSVTPRGDRGFRVANWRMSFRMFEISLVN